MSDGSVPNGAGFAAHAEDLQPTAPTRPDRFSALSSCPGGTTITRMQDYPDWHRGRRRYGVWVAMVEDASLLEYIEAVRFQLADMLHPTEQRQSHLTLFVCGFEQANRKHDDDFTPAQLNTQCTMLRRQAGRTCDLELGSPDSFASAAFLPVLDTGSHLAKWRTALVAAGPEVRQASYVPHITLGLYRRQVDRQELIERLRQLSAPPETLRVERLVYASYDARDQLGPLVPTLEVQLSTENTNSG